MADPRAGVLLHLVSGPNLENKRRAEGKISEVVKRTTYQ